MTIKTWQERGEPGHRNNEVRMKEEIAELRAELDRLKQQEPVAGFILSKADNKTPFTFAGTYAALFEYESEGFATQRLYAAPTQQEAITWGVDWGTHDDRTCVSIVKKYPDGTLEVVATEYEPTKGK